MLTNDQLATVRAALRYWQEEMCPHGSAAIWPYWDTRNLVVLTPADVAALGRQFLPKNVGYALYDVTTKQLASGAISRTITAARKTAGKDRTVVTVLLPPDA